MTSVAPLRKGVSGKAKERETGRVFSLIMFTDYIRVSGFLCVCVCVRACVCVCVCQSSQSFWVPILSRRSLGVMCAESIERYSFPRLLPEKGRRGFQISTIILHSIQFHILDQQHLCRQPLNAFVCRSTLILRRVNHH